MSAEHDDDVRPADASIGLLVLAPGGIRSFELPKTGVSVVGRAATADIFIDHPSISRSHAHVWVDGDVAHVLDLGSRNGTFIKGTAIGDRQVVLKIGDQITFGEVTAELQRVRRTPTVNRAKWVDLEELDRALVVEAERAVRFGQSFGFLRIDLPKPVDDSEEARATLVRTLRIIDLFGQRAPDRIDVLLPGCDKEGALALAERIYERVKPTLPETRIGVAAYPGDAPSAETVPLAAQLAMTRVERGVGTAEDASRVLQIGPHEIVVAEPSMVRLFALIERAAESPLPVLIHGETGSGKEIVAEALHALGDRVGRPLISLNCAAMPEQLLESELFGHERGAFSGAVAAKVGLLEQADGGTVFLDEIAEMPLAIQAKLLRVLENFSIRRVGGVKEKRVDVRLVAASHRELGDCVEAGQFRQDLYYRLNSLVVRVPPLRERRREIPLLAERFAAQAAKEHRRPQLMTLSQAATDALLAYSWPGNIRQLRNVIRSAVMMAPGDVIDLAHLGPELAAHKPAASEPRSKRPSNIELAIKPTMGLKLAVEQLERSMINEALRTHRGNQTRAAAQLGITRQALAQKLTKYGIRWEEA